MRSRPHDDPDLVAARGELAELRIARFIRERSLPQLR